MGLLDKVKKTIKRVDNKVTGGKVVQAVNNGGKAVAPLAKPVLVVAGAAFAGGAGAAAGAAIGDVAGKGLSGKSLKAGPEVELTINVQGGPVPGAPDPSAPLAPDPVTPNADQNLNTPSGAPIPISFWTRFMALLGAALNAMADAGGVNTIPKTPVASPVGSSTSNSNSAPLSYALTAPVAVPALAAPPSAIMLAAAQGKLLKK